MNQWITGMDISTLAEVEECGGRFYENGTEDDALNILKRAGTSMVRLRLWNDPYSETGEPYGAGTNDLEKTIALAKRAKDHGMEWMLDFHYSDFWTDPGKQTVPKAWRSKNADELEEAVYEYTASVLETLKKEDLLPSIAATGNELSNGLLWPYGKVPEYGRIARFVSAGIKAVNEADHNIKTMIHLDNGGNNELYRRWFDKYLQNGGRDFDYIGLSYYPFWHGTLSDLKHNMDDIAERYHKDLIVAEVSAGFTLEDYQAYEQLPDEKRKGMAAKKELADRVPYEMSPQGQALFMKDFMDTVANIKDRRGKGFFYWEPCWLPVPGVEWASQAAIEYMHEKGPGGNEWANQALFDYDGNALDSFNTIREFDRIMNRSKEDE